MPQKTPKKCKVTWITPDYFIDCDFNVPVLTGILEFFDIHWIILLPVRNARYSEKDFEKIQSFSGIEIEFIYSKCRARSPKMLLFYQEIHQRIKSINSEVVYFNEAPVNPYILPFYCCLNKNTTIVTAHDGSVKSSFARPWLSKIVFNLAFRTVRYVNMFSSKEASVFKLHFPKAKIFIIPLGLKDFGVSNIAKEQDNIIFLFFGSIISNKNLGLLIDAACNLFDRGVRGFKVLIKGFTRDWQLYQPRIKYPGLFEVDIRVHQNSEIPDIFSRSHYMVFPYKEISQSGALKVAFNYGLPVVVSDLESFNHEVEEGVNGFFFKSGDVNDLERVMLNIINNHTDRYDSLVKTIYQYNELNYSATVLSGKYIAMLNEVLSLVINE